MLTFDLAAIERIAREVRESPKATARVMALNAFSRVVIESGEAGDLETVRRLSVAIAPDGSGAQISTKARIPTVPRDLPFVVLAARRLAQEGRRFRITLSSFGPLHNT